MRCVLLLAACAAVAGCAGTYQAPTQTAQPLAERRINAEQAAILRAAKIALATEGFQLTLADDQAGVISTAPLDQRLTPAQANCGTTMGIDYLRDKRTATRVSYSVIAGAGTLRVRSVIQGEYKPGAAHQDITLTCVSRGALEQQLLDRITALL